MVLDDVLLARLRMLGPPLVGLLAELPEALAFDRRDDPRVHGDTGGAGAFLDLRMDVIGQVQPKALRHGVII